MITLTPSTAFFPRFAMPVLRCGAAGVALIASLLIGCSPADNTNAQQNAAAEPATPTAILPTSTPFIPTITVMELMRGAIEPASNGIWALAQDEFAPKSDLAWQEVEHQAVQLIAYASTLSLGGSGPNDMKWAAQPQWQEYTQQMAALGMLVRNAARAKDYDSVLEAGNFLVGPCGECHTAFPSDSQ